MTNKKRFLRSFTTYLLTLMVSLFSCALAQGVLEVKIADPNDDAEELVGESSVGPAGSAYLDSSDLELVDDADTTQIVGLRFAGLDLAPNTPITRAYIQFTVDEATSDPTSLSIYGEASDNAAVFSDTANILSSRTPTTLSIPWTPAPWPEQGEAGQAQQTPDLSDLIQEIISRPGWQKGNALVLMLKGEGKRVAESFDGSSGGAAVLHIEFETQAAEPEMTDAAAEVTPEEATPEEATSEEATSEEAGEASEVASDTDTSATVPSEAVTAETSNPETTSTQTDTTEVEAATPEVQPTEPDPANGRRYPLTGDGVTGSVLVTDYGNGTVILTVLVGGQARNDIYGAQLNTGSCDVPGTLLLELEPVRGDRGSLSVTSSKVDYATLTQADLNLTLSPSPDSSETIACGEVGAP